MDFEDAKSKASKLRETLDYHSERYYNQDAPEISDYEYDMLLKRLEELEEQFPELITPDSPTQRVGGKAAEKFAPVTHTVPMESLHDAFSDEEMRDFDRRVRGVAEHPIYVVEPKFDAVRLCGIRKRNFCARLYARRRRDRRGYHRQPEDYPLAPEAPEKAAAVH